jgi:benzoate/toluate 1,2-dioxygenase alpha subunit
MTMLDKVLERLEASVEENEATGSFRCKDPELFELEMKHSWEGNWIYLAHESQIGRLPTIYRAEFGHRIKARGNQ